MDFVCTVLYLIFYYVRPQEWYSFLAAVRPIQLLSFFSVVAILFRERSFEPKDLFKTPLDWLMWSYLGWTIFSNEQPLDTLRSVQGVILCYVLGVTALTSFRRIEMLLWWWCACMMFIAGLAVLSTVGFDPLGSYEKTMGAMKGRLILNLSIFNNPNALAHSVVPVIPMIYYVMFWRRALMRAYILMLAIPIQCVLLTQSKGAFLSGFATVVATLMFGRPKWVQILIGAVVVSGGITAVYSLPRMGELSNTKEDTAIQGRVAAYSFGLYCLEKYQNGVGYGNFATRFFQEGPLEPHQVSVSVNGRTEKRIVMRHYYKAAHSAYSETGAELGYTGLFLFVGILYVAGRTLVMAKTENDTEERVRRVLFCILISYAISSWMVDFGFRGSFFIMAAAISAFHRLLMEKKGVLAAATETPAEKPAFPPPWARPVVPLEPVPSRALAGRGLPPMPMKMARPPVPRPMFPSAQVLAKPAVRTGPLPKPEAASGPEGSEEGEEKAGAPKGTATWRRLTLLDVIFMFVCLNLVMRIWRHILVTY